VYNYSMSEKPRRHSHESSPIDELAEELAPRLAAYLTGGRRRAPREPDTTEIEEKIPPTPDNFLNRVAEAAAAREAARESAGKTSRSRHEKLEDGRHNMEGLLSIAARVASEAHRRGIEPEVSLVRSDTTYKGKILPGDRAQKLKSVEASTLARGWILARTASIVNKNAIIQEVMLGVDGDLHVYTRNDQGSSVTTDLLGKTASRRKIQETAFQTLAPPSKTVDIAPTSRSLKYFHTVSEAGDYPFPPMGGYQSPEESLLTPEVIQHGLEDFFVESRLDAPASPDR
jgi:hypothetical protein